MTLEEPGQLYFAKAFTDKDFKIGVLSHGGEWRPCSFLRGSRLLAVRDGVPNKVLGALLGSELSLSVMDYQVLLDAKVDLFQFTDAALLPNST